MEAVLRRALAGVSTRPGNWERARGWLLSRLMGLLGRIFGVAFGGRIRWLGWVAVAAAVFLAVLALRRIRILPDKRIHSRGSRSAPGPDWELEAQAAEASGDLALAARYLYRLLLSALAGRGLVPDSPTLTARECGLAVKGAAPALYQGVAQAGDVFESAAYGQARIQAQDLEKIRAARRMASAA